MTEKAPERIYMHPTSAEANVNPSPLEPGEYVEYVRADLLATVPAASWQSIEMNSKDGTWQIVAKFDDDGKMVRWQRAYWRSRTGEWKTEGGSCVPTHWTLLPAAPVLEVTEK